jgi:cyanophycinase
MKLSEARGKLVVIGGGEDKEGDAVVLTEFVRAAKGVRARIVVLTVATDEPDEVGKEYVEILKRLGAGEVRAADVSTRADAASEELLELVRKATGLFFTGGDQLHITSLLGGTELQAVMQERYEKGLVIAGTSAGAAMMSNSMILGGPNDESPRAESVEIGPGMDLIIGAMIDTHFSERGRHGRLLTAVAHYPQDLGIGIDEDTALLVERGEFEVVGSGAVTVIDAGAMSFTNLPDVEKEDALALFGVKLHVLPAGHRFDLSRREPVVVNGAGKRRAKAKAARAESGKPSGKPTGKSRGKARAESGGKASGKGKRAKKR